MTSIRNSALDYAQKNKEAFLSTLGEFVSIPSVSTDPDLANSMLDAANWLIAKLEEQDFTTRLIATPKYPLVFAERTIDPAYPTVLIYGHYDVQPTDPLELWETPPFEPSLRDESYFGRGVSDMKGQIVACLSAVESIIKTTDLHLNLKWILEGEEEIGSPSLPPKLEEYKELLQSDIVFNPDSGMIAKNTPTITYALRGLAYFELRVYGPKTDLHSGMFGGVVHNPAQVLCDLISGMHDDHGRITLPGYYDSVVPLSEKDRKQIEELPINEETYKQQTGVPELWGEEGYTPAERTGARPTLDVNGMYSGFTGHGSKTIIPSWAMAKISMRLVPDQDPAEVQQQLVKYLQMNAPDTVRWELTPMSGAPASITRTDLPEVNAFADALERAWGKKPLFKREGGSIPIAFYMKASFGSDSILGGFGLPDDHVHAPNEKLDLPTWYTGINALIHFLINMQELRK
jgi:acetylornithine deacetylase/succinyl-diaminopimelate desuccinylase-like protein